MNVKNLLVVLSSAAVLTSCSSAYRSGQTPDDVYYSPSRPQQQDEYVDVERQQGRYNDRNGTANNYDDYDGYRDDRFLRMSMGSPYRLSAYNDYMLYNGYMGFNNFRYNSMGLGFNNPWNSFYYWNSFYNPYTSYDFYNPYYYGGLGGGYIPGGGGVIVKSPSVNPISRPRAFNPGAYTPNSLGNANRYLDRPAATNGSYRTPINSGSRYNNRNSNNSGLGNTMRRVLGGNGESSYYNNGRSTNSANNRNSDNNSNNNTYTAPQRTYEAPTRSYSPPPASSGGGNTGGGGGGGVSRPTRGGN